MSHVADELQVHIAPVVFGGPRERLFEGVSQTELEPLPAAVSPRVSHIKCAVRAG